jgi:hypothetical protein
MTIHQHVRDFANDSGRLASDYGIILPGTRSYLPKELKRDFRAQVAAAFDMAGLGKVDSRLGADAAQPILTTSPNSAIPAMLTTFIDPDILMILFAANKAAKILGAEGQGERKKGDWTEMVAMFPIVELTGQVTSYGDYNSGGSAGMNMSFPQRQSYHYQTILGYGEREIAMAARAQVDIASQKKRAAVVVLDKFQNNSYLYGVSGLQNYGILNDPSLPAPIQPGPKAYGAQAHGPWITSGVITATPNEIYTDIQSLFIQLVNQTDGLVELDQESKLVLVMSPVTETALTSANSFNVDVFDLLKKNFPNMRFETAVQYNTAAGQLVQMIAEDVEGQETGYCAFTEKLRAHPLIQMLSAWEQKMSQGTWGAVIRQPFAFAQMLGV